MHTPRALRKHSRVVAMPQKHSGRDSKDSLLKVVDESRMLAPPTLPPALQPSRNAISGLSRTIWGREADIPIPISAGNNPARISSFSPPPTFITPVSSSTTSQSSPPSSASSSAVPPPPPPPPPPPDQFFSSFPPSPPSPTPFINPIQTTSSSSQQGYSDPNPVTSTITIHSLHTTVATLTLFTTETATSSFPDPIGLNDTSSQHAGFTIHSTDGIIITSLSSFACVLLVACGIFLFRRHKKKQEVEEFQDMIHPISFHQSVISVDARSHTTTTGSISSASFRGGTPLRHSDYKHRYTPSPNRDSGSLSSIPGTPTRMHGDPFDSRWPGRHLPRHTPASYSHRGSGATASSTQVVREASAQPQNASASGFSNQSEYHSSSPTVIPPTPARTRSTVKHIPVFEPSHRRGIPSPVQEQTWDDPPPESERAESAKSGPPAYTPDSPVPPLDPSIHWIQSLR